MNICYISNSSAPSTNASSLQIAKLCEYISKLGHNVKLILPNTGFKKNFYSFYKIKRKYEIKRLKYFTKFPKGINYYLYSLIAILYSNFLKKDLFITRNFFTSFLLSILNKNHILREGLKSIFLINLFLNRKRFSKKIINLTCRQILFYTFQKFENHI